MNFAELRCERVPLVWMRRYPDAVSRTCCVYFTDPQRKQYGHVTAAASVYEAASEALDWFADPHWRGPKPTPQTVLEVTLVGDDRRWRVLVRRVLEWRAYTGRYVAARSSQAEAR